MNLLQICFCSFVLESFLVTCFIAENLTVSLNVLSPCTLDNSFEFFVGLAVSDCIQECQQRTLCAAINYNRYNALCALRNSSVVELTGLEAEWCYDVVVNNETDVLKGPCRNNPCDDTSVCRNSSKYPFYTCSLAYCISETNISNASFRNKAPTPIGKKNEIQCDRGFTSSGLLSHTCLPNGTWSATDLHCLKTCPSIPLKSTATVLSWSTYRFVLNTTVTYTCKEGFYNLTERKIVCDEFGEWSKFDCIPYCRQADLVPIKNGNNVPGDYYTIHMLAEYSCEPSYYLSPGSRFVTCDVNGHWSIPEVACYPFCKQDDLPHVTNGNPLSGTLYNFTMTAMYSCDTGYYLSSGSPKVSCDTAGSWSTPEIECYPYCQQPNIGNGYILAQAQEPIMKDVNVQYGCNGDYYAYPPGGTPTATCLKTGAWNIPASCYKYCGSAPVYEWEKVDYHTTPSPYTVNTKAYYKCAVIGMHFSGGGSIKSCNQNGNWDGEVHCCAVTFKYENGKCVWSIGK